MRPILILLGLQAALAVDYIRPFGPEISTNLPTDDVETLTDYCGDDAESYYEAYETKKYRFVIISGVPSHDAEYGQVKANPNTRCKHSKNLHLPKYSKNCEIRFP